MVRSTLAVLEGNLREDVGQVRRTKCQHGKQSPESTFTIPTLSEGRPRGGEDWYRISSSMVGSTSVSLTFYC